MEKFFDSHLHATLKHHFASEGKEVSAWETLTPMDLTNNFPGVLGAITKYFLKNFIISTLRSQSSLSQLIEGRYGICIMSLYSPDKDLLNALYSNSGFNDIIKNVWFGEILDEKKLEQLIKGTEHFPILIKDLEMLQEVSSKGKVNFLQNASDLIEQEKTLNLVFSVEGLHCLRSDTNVIDTVGVLGQLKDSLDIIAGKGAKVISSTITHIDNENQLFANQAYAMDGMRNMGLEDGPLRPVGNGLTQLGKEAILVLEERGIFSDIKHMSFKARKDLYAFRNIQSISSPIVCTHAGLTGIPFHGPGMSYQDLIIYAKKVNTSFEIDNQTVQKDHIEVQLAKTQSTENNHFNTIGFNSTSINLYDEDVYQIYTSSGILGVSLDARILGYVKLFGNDDFNQGLSYISEFALHGQGYKLIRDTEFFTPEEFQALGLQLTGPKHQYSNCIHYDNLHGQIGGNGSAGNFAQFQHFLANVCHAVRLGQNWDGSDGVEKMLLETLCIGSDYDGLIDSIWYASDCTEIGYLKKRFQEHFPRTAKRFGIELPKGLTAQVAADHLFYENGKNFVLKHL
jgi:microsomal dipeptidase-like Zn-dependent dipeptidase